MSFFDTLRRRFQKQNINKETDEKHFSKQYFAFLNLQNFLNILKIKIFFPIYHKSFQNFLNTYEQFINEIKSTQPTLCAQCLEIN